MREVTFYKLTAPDEPEEASNPREWEVTFDPKRPRLTPAECAKLESLFADAVTFSELYALVWRGSIKYTLAVCWIYLKRTKPQLKYADFVASISDFEHIQIDLDVVDEVAETTDDEIVVVDGEVVTFADEAPDPKDLDVTQPPSNDASASESPLPSTSSALPPAEA